MRLRALLTLSVLLASGSAFATLPLIGAEVVDQAQYPAVVWIEHCTATVVGPRTIITAAHCNLYGTVSFTTAGKTYTAKLTNNTQYDEMVSYMGTLDGENLDLALGHLSEDVVGITPYYVGGEQPTVGETLTLFGYGCTQPDDSGRDGKLRTGPNAITEVRKNGILLTGLDGGASGCPGDSGGPAFGVLPNGKWTVKSVAAQVGFLENGDRRPETYETRTDTEDARKLLKAFADEHSAVICGFNSSCN